jgi:hypothetical protein
VLPLQHPLGHELASQTHDPLALHSVPEPHFTQAAPPVPQVGLEEVWQLPDESQQPLPHDDASHTHLPALLQCWPVAHTPQATPPVAHMPAVSDA